MKKRVLALYENRICRVIVVVILSAMALLSVYKGIENAQISQDFQWDAAKALSLRINPYRESLSPTGALDGSAFADYYGYYEKIGAPQKMEANQFPSLLMLLLPYTFLHPDTARIAWVITNLLCTAGIIMLLYRTFFKGMEKYPFCVLMLLMLAGTPYRNQLGVGQHTLFSFFFFLLAVWLVERPKGSIPAALSLAVSYFKYTLTAPLALYFVYKRKWKELILSISVHIALTVIAAIWLKERLIDMIIQPLKVSSALISEGGLDFGALFRGSIASMILAAAVMAVLTVVALKAREGRDGMLFSVLLLWSLIMLYHRTYDFFVLIAVAAAFRLQDPGDGVFPGRWHTAAAILYGIVLFTVFFVLRLFHETLPARIFAGVLYYAFTILMTALLIYDTGSKKNGK